VAGPKSVRAEVNAREAPAVSIMSLHLQTIANDHVNEVVVVSALCHDSVHVDGRDHAEGGYSGFTGVCRPDAEEWPGELRGTVEGWNGEHETTPRSMHASERALLSWFAAKVQAVDPDVLVGHNCVAGDLDVLLSRMQALKVEGRSKLGRLRRKSNVGRQRATPGRLVCDTFVAAKEHLKETTYSLSELSRTQLGETREEVHVRDVSGYFGASGGVMALLTLNERDAELTVALMLKLAVLPLSKQLANLAGNLWSRSLLGARAERVEYLLLHEFHRLKYILPEKVAGSGKRQREQEAEVQTKKGGLSGGLVLEPKKGLYAEPVLVLDFKSLYPSIIQEYNICFTTVRAAVGVAAGEKPVYELPGKESKAGVLPSVMKTLVERRRQVQALMRQEAAEDRKRQYDIRQLALKVMANSMYGCLGCRYSRFYAEPLAEMVTSQGRVILQQAVDLTQNKCRLEVVYGDTDSIFVKAGCGSVADAKRVAREVQRTLNRTWKLLEVGLEGVYCPLLLVSKKKYAALAVTERDGVVTKQKVCKGLDSVRRDCCGLAKKTADEVLEFVLSGEPVSEVVDRIHALLRKLRCDVDKDLVPVSEFVITKCLGKSPGEYADADVQAHVQVALKLQALGRTVRAGEHVAYVVTAKEGAKNFAQRAEDPGTVETSGGRMTLDKKWYMQAQVHAAVSRICAVVQGTDSGQLGECLGLKAKVCKGPAAEGKFDKVEKLHGMCSDGVCREFLGAYVVDATGVRSGMRATDGAVFKPAAMRVQLDRLFRKCLARYTDGWLVCGEDMCQQRTRNVVCDAACGLQCTVGGCTGEMRVEYTSRELYDQMLYMQQLFDFEEAARKLAAANAGRVKQGVLPLRAPKMGDAEKNAINVLHGDCQRMLAQSAYGRVDLARLFLGLK
jgi:DNA polymerase alpha subunit A